MVNIDPPKSSGFSLNNINLNSNGIIDKNFSFDPNSPDIDINNIKNLTISDPYATWNQQHQTGTNGFGETFGNWQLQPNKKPESEPQDQTSKNPKFSMDLVSNGIDLAQDITDAVNGYNKRNDNTLALNEAAGFLNKSYRGTQSQVASNIANADYMKYKNKYDYGYIGNADAFKKIGAAAGSGAVAGSQFGGWGAAIGAVVRGLGSAASVLGTNYGAKEQARHQNRIANSVAANQTADMNFAVNESNANYVDWTKRNSMDNIYTGTGFAALGGRLFQDGGYAPQMEMGDYNPQSFNPIQAGGSHQENPYQGVQQGIAPDGQPNLVEEGETVVNIDGDKYVFSRRLKVGDPKKFNLPNKIKGMSFAQASEYLLEKSGAKESPNERPSITTNNVFQTRLRDMQEYQKEQSEKRKNSKIFNSLSPEQQQMMLAQAAQQAQRPQQEQQEQQPSEEEMLAMQQAQQQEQVPQQMMARGGHLFEEGDPVIVKSYTPVQNKHNTKWGLSLDDLLKAYQEAVLQKNSELMTELGSAYMGAGGDPSDLDRIDSLDSWSVPNRNDIKKYGIQYGVNDNGDVVGMRTAHTVPSWFRSAFGSDEFNNDRHNWDWIRSSYSDITKSDDPNTIGDITLKNPKIKWINPLTKQKEVKQKEVTGGDDETRTVVPYVKESELKEELEEKTTKKEKTKPNLARLNDIWNSADLRYAPIWKSGLDVLTDTLGLTNKEDFSNVDEYQRQINSLRPRNVISRPTGNLQRYTPNTHAGEVNQLRQVINANNAAIGERYGANTAGARQALLLNNYAGETTIGNQLQQLRAADEERRNKIIADNNSILAQNAQNDMTAQANNQNAQATYDQLRAAAAEKVMNSRESIAAAASEARNANRNQFALNLGELGKENYINAQNADLAKKGYYRITSNSDGTFNFIPATSNEEKKDAYGGLLYQDGGHLFQGNNEESSTISTGNTWVDNHPLVTLLPLVGAANEAYKGNWWKAAGNLALDAVSLIPFGKAMQAVKVANKMAKASKAVGKTINVKKATEAAKVAESEATAARDAVNSAKDAVQNAEGVVARAGKKAKPENVQKAKKAAERKLKKAQEALAKAEATHAEKQAAETVANTAYYTAMNYQGQNAARKALGMSGTILQNAGKAVARPLTNMAQLGIRPWKYTGSIANNAQIASKVSSKLGKTAGPEAVETAVKEMDDLYKSVTEASKAGDWAKVLTDGETLMGLFKNYGIHPTSGFSKWFSTVGSGWHYITQGLVGDAALHAGVNATFPDNSYLTPEEDIQAAFSYYYNNVDPEHPSSYDTIAAQLLQQYYPENNTPLETYIENVKGTKKQGIGPNIEYFRTIK